MRADGDWLAALRARVQRPPERPREPFALAATADAMARTVGSVEPRVLQSLPPLLDTAELQRRPGSWCLCGDATPALEALAQVLRQAGWAHAWRDEQLAVADATGLRLGTVERAVVRPLGIATRAVHLVGYDTDGRVWLQQRAWTKANDPGRWDTLMGGMVAAVDDHDQAMARETWEEAGLRLQELHGLRHGGCVHVRRPADDGGDAGYVVEDIDWSSATLPAGVTPCNQDGEVERFECVDRAEVVRRLHAGAFTDEAALILVEALSLAP